MHIKVLLECRVPVTGFQSLYTVAAVAGINLLSEVTTGNADGIALADYSLYIGVVY